MKIDKKKRRVLMDTAAELKVVLDEIQTKKTGKRKMEFNTEKDAHEWAKEQGKKIKNVGNTSNGVMFEVQDEFKKDLDFGGDPSEVEGYEGMSYKEVLEKALAAENEAIFLGLYAVQLATSKGDIKALVEITNDENHHASVYKRILDKLRD